MHEAARLATCPPMLVTVHVLFCAARWKKPHLFAENLQCTMLRVCHSMREFGGLTRPRPSVREMFVYSGRTHVLFFFTSFFSDLMVNAHYSSRYLEYV